MSNIKFSQLPNLGNIQAATIVPVVDDNTNYTVSAANLRNYINSSAGNISATGNITASYFLGNGSQLTGLPATYGNANVAAFLPTYGGNITAYTISAVGNVTGAYIFGNGSQLSGLPQSYGNANVATFLASFGSNAISTTGNVTAGYVLGNISLATGGYGNSNVQAVLQTYTGSLTAASVSVTGNITANRFIGNGSSLTGISASLGGTMVSNISGANTYSINNLVNLSASGNISGTYTGSGSQLTGIPTSITAGTGISVSASTGAVTISNNNPNPYANANVAAYLPIYSGSISASSINATNISATGNVTGTHLGNGAGLSSIVTSITAGSGISINSTTGAVTITATGGGGSGGSYIVGGNNYANTVANTAGGSNSFVISAGPTNSSVFTGLENGILLIRNGNTASSLGGTIAITSAGSVNINSRDSAQSVNINTAGTTNMATVNVQALNSTSNIQGNASIFAFYRFVAQAGGQASFNAPLFAPAASTSTGTTGDITWNANYIYVCVGTNSWKRVALTTF